MTRLRSNSRRARYGSQQKLNRLEAVFISATDPCRWLAHTLWITAAGGSELGGASARYWRVLGDVRYGLHFRNGKFAWRD